MTVEELQARQDEIQARLQELNAEHAGVPFPEDARVEWAALNEERDENDKLIEELEVRRAIVDRNAQEEKRTEMGDGSFAVHVRKTDADIYDLTQVRVSAQNPAAAASQLRDNAKHAIERASYPTMDTETAQGNVERMLDRSDDQFGNVARRILLTGRPEYARGWAKYIAGQKPSAEEERVMSLTTNSGGYGVPFALDPTIILSSDGGINPFRQIARVEQINVDIWQGITSAGVTASFDTELSEVSDDSMTIAQPNVTTYMARAFVPFSIEIGMDYPNFAAQVARAISDSKDVLEASQFATGSGSTPHGIITDATGVVTASTRGSITSTDVYAVEGALGPRFLQNASWVASRAALQKFRQFDTAGGAQLWIQNLQYGLGRNGSGFFGPTQGQVGYTLLGWPAYASSGITATLTTGNKVAVLGDFSQFLIVDRIGLSTEFIPHMFNVANNLPSGERGIFAYWRVGSAALFTNAFRTFLL